MSKIGVICAGHWGTSLAQTLAHSGNNVLLYTNEKDVAKNIKRSSCNTQYMPKLQLKETIEATTNLKTLFKECEILFVAAPTVAYEEIFTPMKKYVRDEHLFVIASKGFRQKDGALPSQILQDIFGNNIHYAVLSGPVFASEVSKQKPCALTIHSEDKGAIKRVDSVIQAPYIRIYYGNDPVGAQLCGVIKNTIALASGMADGLDLGDSARAAIVTRGIIEMERYITEHGGKSETVFNISGMGDAIMASTSTKSRHYRYGKLIGQGMPVEEALKIENGFLEGTLTARIIIENSVGKGIDLGIISVIDAILHGDITAQKGFEHLLSRPRGYE